MCFRDKILNGDQIKGERDKIEFALNAIRWASNVVSDTLPTSAACSFLLSASEIPLIQVEFLLYIPHPETNYHTAYKLKNLKTLLNYQNN